MKKKKVKEISNLLKPPKAGEVSGIIDSLYCSLLKLIRAAAASTMVQIQHTVMKKYPLLSIIFNLEQKSPQNNSEDKKKALSESYKDLLEFRNCWDKFLTMVRSHPTSTDYNLTQIAADLYKDFDAPRRALVSSMEHIARSFAENEQVLLFQLYEARLTTVRAAVEVTKSMLNLYHSELEQIAIKATNFQKEVDDQLQPIILELQEIVERFFEEWRQVSQEYFKIFGHHPCTESVKKFKEALKAVCPYAVKGNLSSGK